jgi:hypothetical protein
MTVKKFVMIASAAALLALCGCQANQKAKTCESGQACKGTCDEKCDGKCDGKTCCEAPGKAAVDTTPMNKVCPIGGHGAEKMIVVAYKGKNIGFCCQDCVESFGDMSAQEKDEVLAKAEAEAAKGKGA